MSTGLVVNCGLTCELDVALSAASRLLDERFNGMLDAWEAQMAKEAAERETNRRLQCKAEEERLEALAAQGLIDVWEVRVRAGARHSAAASSLAANMAREKRSESRTYAALSERIRRGT